MASQPRRRGARGLRDLLKETGVMLRQRPDLRRSAVRWLLVGLIFTDGLSLGVALLHGSAAVTLLAGSTLWWLIVSAVVVGGMPLLVTPEGEQLCGYGLPNGLSAIRAWSCYPLLLCASFHLPDHLSLILWSSVGAVAGMLDLVDGFLARHVGPISELGKAIDPAGDATFFATAAVGCFELGIVPLWLMILMLVRYLGPLLATPIVLLALRRRPEMVRTQWGRASTALVGVLLAILLTVRLMHGPVDTVALIVALPTLAATTLLHFISLSNRLRKSALAS